MYTVVAPHRGPRSEKLLVRLRPRQSFKQEPERGPQALSSSGFAACARLRTCADTGCGRSGRQSSRSVQAFVPRRFSQLSDATWDVGVLLLGEAVGLELGWLGVADLAGPQVMRLRVVVDRLDGTSC